MMLCLHADAVELRSGAFAVGIEQTIEKRAAGDPTQGRAQRLGEGHRTCYSVVVRPSRRGDRQLKSMSCSDS
ncbi:hypothetical protein CR51_38910 [Caballeronia megalochromosomata]|nr:hypothetical protein CR51_38910 [Caballeronia megalochromosomata]